jgi:hypothetical protein
MGSTAVFVAGSRIGSNEALLDAGEGRGRRGGGLEVHGSERRGVNSPRPVLPMLEFSFDQRHKEGWFMPSSAQPS